MQACTQLPFAKHVRCQTISKTVQANKTFVIVALLMTHMYRGSIVVLSISKSVEPNEEQKEMISGF